jgi:hypothetical protein
MLPEGSHEVRFLYDPPVYKIGWWVALAGLVLTLALVVPVRKLFV